MARLTVAAVQHDIAWEDRAANLAGLAGRVGSAAAAGAGLVVLTEMFSTGFSMATERIVEGLDGPSSTFLVEQAYATGAWVCGSIPIRWAAGELPRNTFTLAGPAGQLYRYAKIHPFTYAREHDHYRPGDEVVTVDVDGVRVTPFVCYDLRFADEFWSAAHDTDLFVVPANWPEKRRLAWMTLLQARAIENQAYVVGVNRVGEGDGLLYAGDSRIVDPLGELLATASRVPTTLVADVDTAYVAEVRARFPFLQDRR